MPHPRTTPNKGYITYKKKHNRSTIWRKEFTVFVKHTWMCKWYNLKNDQLPKTWERDPDWFAHTQNVLSVLGEFFYVNDFLKLQLNWKLLNHIFKKNVLNCLESIHQDLWINLQREWKFMIFHFWPMWIGSCHFWINF